VPTRASVSLARLKSFIDGALPRDLCSCRACLRARIANPSARLGEDFQKMKSQIRQSLEAGRGFCITKTHFGRTDSLGHLIGWQLFVLKSVVQKLAR
jgi:hypothetical protein